MVIKEDVKKEKVYAKAIKRKELIKNDLEERAKDIFNFLGAVHPSALEDTKDKMAIEVRFLLRGDGLTSGLHSFNTWNLKEGDLEQLIRKLNEYNGLSCCSYYSLFTYDYYKLINDKQPRKIRKASSIYCETLAIDFDGMDLLEFLKYKRRLSNLNIETYDIFTGHGYQTLILLDEKCYDTGILKRFTKLVLRKGFKADSAIKDPSRVLRLPFTFNCKAYAKDDNQYYNPIDPEPIQTKIINKTAKRYNVDEIFRKLETLEDVKKEVKETKEEITKEEIIYSNYDEEGFFGMDEEWEEVKPAAPVKEKQEEVQPKQPKETKTFTTGKEKEIINVEIKTKEEMATLYTHFNYFKIPSAMQNLLMGSPDGTRNLSLLFIVPYLRNGLGLSIKEQIETMEIWGDHCNPAISPEEIEKEVTRLNIDYPNFEAKYGDYTELEEVFGELNFREWINEEDIIINNVVFEQINKISDGAFRVYLAVKLLEHEENKSNFTNDEIYERAGISESTFKRHISYLTKTKLITKKKLNRIKGEKYEYYLNPFESRLNGFTKISASLVELMLLKDFTDSEISLYAYLKHMVGNKDASCYASQIYLALALNKSQNRISELTDELHKKKFIRKEVKKIGRVKHSTYKLLK